VKDFFISYTSSDGKWAEWIAWELEAADYSVVVQLWDFHPGNDFIAEMDRASREAGQTLAVLSPKYFQSRFTEAEWTAAFKKGNLLPVRVVDFDVEGLLSVRAYIDVAGKNEDQAREVLLEGVKRERRKPSVAPGFPADTADRSIKEQPQFPGALSPIWNVPHQRNPNFVGRDAMLDQIHKTLTSKNAAALTAIHGMGGVGKTQLAAEYAYHHAGDYQVVWWIKSEEPAALASDYAALAEALDLPQKQERDQKVIVAAVRDWLNHNGAWLLIFDNARRKEDLREWLPQNRAGHVVITSRDPNWAGVAKPLEVEVLTREDAVRFLLQRTGQDDAEAARLLAEALGDLPLALEQAGAYIETTGKPISEYLALFKTRHGELMQRGQPDDYPDTVATTWEISFQAAQQESPAAAELLNLCAFLAPDDIPIAVLREGKERLPDLLAETVADELRFDEAIAVLRRYSLIERNEDGLFVHRLVQMVGRDRLLDDERRVSAEAAVHIVDDAFPFDSDDVRTWADCERLLPHAVATADFGEELQLAPEATGRLWNQMGLYYRGRARYAEAKQSYERAIRIVEATFGHDDADVATCVNNLGLVLKDLGDLTAACECYAAHYKSMKPLPALTIPT
jgi:tetratricopeptide (TPR) repeat protein